MTLTEQVEALTEELRASEARVESLKAARQELEAEIRARTPPWLRPSQHPEEIADSLRKGSVSMHSGATLFWQVNKAGGRTYSSDEIGGGVEVWDTCLVGYATLCEAMSIEFALLAAEQRAERKRNSQASAEYCTATSADIDAAINEVDRADKRLLEILLRARESILILEQRRAMEAQRAANPDADEVRPAYSPEDFPKGLSRRTPEAESND